MGPKKDESQILGRVKKFQDLTVNSKASATQHASPSSSRMAGPTSNRNVSGHTSMSHVGNASASNLSPMKEPLRNSALRPPPFVSPGRAAAGWNRGSNYATPSYLDKPSGTPQQRPRTSVQGMGFGLAFSPSPVNGGKKKVEAKSWREKPSPLSFQATSPVKQKELATPTFSQHYGGSFLDKTTPSSRRRHNGSDSEMLETPDIKIEVKIPNIDEKIRARRQPKLQTDFKSKEENVPEWLVKQRQREANVKRKQEEKEDRAASLVQAAFLGWYARAKYPLLLAENAERLKKMKEVEQLRNLKRCSAIKIQKNWRMFLPRKRFKFLRECRRRRERNEKEIKKITKTLAKLPKTTKAEIKEMKKSYDVKKKELKKQLKSLLKEDEKKLEDINKSGRDMIEFLQAENKKLKEKQVAMKKEYHLLEQQFDLLTMKSEEISQNFASLQGYVQKKTASIQKNEINSQKCRHRYLPKYRGMIKDRDRHCIVEHRIGVLYKKRLRMIVALLEERCQDNEIVFDAKEALSSLEFELNSMPTPTIPEGLAHLLEEIGD